MRKEIFCILLLILVGVVSASTTTDIYPTTDAVVGRQNAGGESFATVISATGNVNSTTLNSTIFLEATTSSSQYDQNDRYIAVFNISASGVPSTAIISSAKLRLFGDSSKSSGLGSTLFGIAVVNASATSFTLLRSTDYNKIGSTYLSNIIPYASLANEANNNLTLNAAGIAYLNLTGLFALGLKNTWDINASFGGTWASGAITRFSTVQSSWTGTSYDPYLELVWTTPDTTPPASITGLANTTTCNSVNWTWTNPADSDFSKTYVLENTVFYSNLSNTTTSSNWSGLASSNTFTFSSKTCDLTGNCNTTWVNQSAVTPVCSNPAATFTANVTTGTSPLSVQFNDTSTNTPTGWSWFFGDESYNQSWVQQTSAGEYPGRANYYGDTPFPNGNILVSAGVKGIGGSPVWLNDTWTSSNKGINWTQISSNAPWTGRADQGTVILPNGSIVVFGGAATDSFTFWNDTWISIDSGATWTLQNASSGWQARHAMGFTTLSDGSILLSGGLTNTGYYNDTWISSDKGVTWTQKSTAPGWRKRYSFAMAPLPGNIVLLTGGVDDTTYSDNDTWKSTDNGVTWSLVNASGGWIQRGEQDLIGLQDGSALLVNGWNSKSNTYYNDVWRSSDQGATWTQLTGTTGWGVRSLSMLTQIPDGSILMYGGIPDYNDTWRLNPVGSSIKNATHTFGVGNWSIHLTSANAVGYNLSSQIMWVNVSAGGGAIIPTASFTENLATIRIPGTYIVNSTSTNTPTLWNWSWGDGTWTNGTAGNTTHKYMKRGAWDVYLIASNAFGSNISATQKVRVIGYENN